MNNKPDFIVLGAPKCGTSSVYCYLSQHPDIFVPKAKEQHFFATDLQPQKPLRFEEYAALFDDYQNEKRIGDVAVLYMYSKTAIFEIKKLLGEIQVICQLRNPVEACYAMHSQMVWGDQEDERDFVKALDLEAERKHGQKLPRNLYHHPNLLQYRDTFRMGEQLERILSVMPRNNVFILFQEDLQKNTEGEISKLFRFLGVNEDVPIDFSVVNSSKKVRFSFLQTVLFDRASPVRKLGSVLITDRGLKRSIIDFIRARNSAKAPRRPIPAELRVQLCQYFRDDIEKLEMICGRDLGHWKCTQSGK